MSKPLAALLPFTARECDVITVSVSRSKGSYMILAMIYLVTKFEDLGCICGAPLIIS